MLRVFIIFMTLVSSLVACSPDLEEVTVLEGHAFETKAYYYETSKPGKRIVIVGGIHGDELAGWQASDMILEDYKTYIDSGSLLIIPHMNEQAIQEERRYAEGYSDLNRSFLGEGDTTTVELSQALKKLVIDFKPDVIIDHHESLNNYQNGRLGNSLIVTDYGTNVLDILEILDIMNPSVVDDLPFTIDANPPEGSFNNTLTNELGILVITIETNRKLDLDKRVEEQLLAVKSILEFVNK